MTGAGPLALPLPADEVHLWYLLPEAVAAVADPAALLSTYAGLLTAAEHARRDRYLFDHSRREYLLTRALVRTTLSRYAPVAPADWRFRENAYGCPEIDPGVHGALASLRFNLSNTRGLIACVVAADREIGVDVEDTQRTGETVGIADRFFSPSEVTALRALPEAARRERFFDYWTLKEAYIKARGMGLAIPLDHFSFLLDDEGSAIRIATDPRLGDDASSWQFAQFALAPTHRASAAVRRGAGPDVRFVVRATVPLVD